MVPLPQRNEARNHDVTERGDLFGTVGSTSNARPLGSSNGCNQDRLVEQLIESTKDTQQAINKKRRVERYLRFVAVKNEPDEVKALCSFLAEAIMGNDESKYPVFQTFRNYLSAIEEYREDHNLPCLSEAPLLRQLVGAAKRVLPKSSCKLNDPGAVYNPRTVISESLSKYAQDPSYQNLRLIALLALRTTALLRGKDAHSIRRNTIKVTYDVRGRKILVFEYHGKSAKKMGMSNESNYVEFLEPSMEDHCPASWIMKLKETIDNQEGVSHNSLFTFVTDKNKPLQSQSINPLITKFLISIGIEGHSGHSIRSMTSEFLDLVAKVPENEIQLRGWKSKAHKTNTRLLHYRSRMTDNNFAELLWKPNSTS